MIASSAGHTNIVDLLIKKGVGVNHCNNAGHTSLQVNFFLVSYQVSFQQTNFCYMQYAASRDRPEV